MSKKALCIGVNDYPYEATDLNGCVNDAVAWADLLISYYGFDEVRVLIDSSATKANIVAGLDDLLASTQPGDILVYTFSGHGTYVWDPSTEEKLVSKACCPYDCADNLITQDELWSQFDALPDGVLLTTILDAGFFGAATRVLTGAVLYGLSTPDDRRRRYLHPAIISGAVLDDPWRTLTQLQDRESESYPEHMNGIQLLGCSDREYAYEAIIDGVYHGAMTFHAIKTIVEADFRITYQELQELLAFSIEDSGFAQVPELKGPIALLERRVFN